MTAKYLDALEEVATFLNNVRGASEDLGDCVEIACKIATEKLAEIARAHKAGETAGNI